MLNKRGMVPHLVLGLLSVGVSSCAFAQYNGVYDELSISHIALKADDTTLYTVTFKVSDPDGADDIRTMRVLLNYIPAENAADGVPSSRGYMAWWNELLDPYRQMEVATPAIGGGTGGFDADKFGFPYITYVSCHTSVQGNQRTVVWTFKVKPAWATAGPHSPAREPFADTSPATGNFVRGFAADKTHFGSWLTVPTTARRSFSVIPASCVGDGDGDGICDTVEHHNTTPAPGRTNRWLVDSDRDGLLDGEEDKDRDNVQDAGETSPRNRDSDGDRFEDGIEILLGTNPLAANPGFADSDNDGLPNSADAFPGRDADGDRFDDGYDAAWHQDLSAAASSAHTPPLGDANGDGLRSNLDALLAQSLFLGNATIDFAGFDQGPHHRDGYRYLDLNGDSAISNADALTIQSFFLANLPVLPLRAP